MGELLRGSLLIFDEAHNVEDAAREAGSVDLPMREMATLALTLTLGAARLLRSARARLGAPQPYPNRNPNP